MGEESWGVRGVGTNEHKKPDWKVCREKKGEKKIAKGIKRRIIIIRRRVEDKYEK